MKRISLISTGGTIASRWQGTGYAADAGGDTVLASAAVPDGMEVKVVDLFNINSSQMTSEHQLALLRAVREELADPGVDGIVVTHGTDTLEESAFLVDLYHDDPRPVVFTGAQKPLGATDGDGPGNMYDALQVAASVRDLGVLVAFDGKVHAARGTVKTQTLAANAFGNPSQPEALGRLGFGRVDIRRTAERPAPLPPPVGRIPRVDIVMHHSDADPTLFDAAVEAGAQGIVLVATGAGNATPAFTDAVRAAVRRGVLVAVTTRVPAGPLAEIYTGGGAVDLVAAGAVLTGTLRAGQARIAVLATLLAGSGADTGLLRRLVAAPEQATEKTTSTDEKAAA
ncbi:asparaginase [Streptomyces sp. VRA16 Mangrove soil]|uniref:asparaginase n=1 Tax=Streptomyces sp. VRA16 Mangrove soil TaxID=2817434 RepID=UPI001A9F1AC1|nr:asparaginase [Streptomyces sp. VRA16 Mangrove soil]MBO1337988.1 asparaginase [Streptomyces sp. VRA16 Mangrove soil]